MQQTTLAMKIIKGQPCYFLFLKNTNLAPYSYVILQHLVSTFLPAILSQLCLFYFSLILLCIFCSHWSPTHS